MVKLFISLFFLLFFQMSSAQAYYTFLTTGDIPRPNTYKGTGFIQFITDGPVGTTLNAQLESYLREDASLLLGVGAGTHQVVSVALKWVPVPDLSTQASLGLLLGAHYGSFKTRIASDLISTSQQDFSVFVKTFVSKQLPLELGEMKSFASLHLGVQVLEGETKIPALLSVGTELKLFSRPDLNFTGELGFNLNQAFTYLSMGLIFLY